MNLVISGAERDARWRAGSTCVTPCAGCIGANRCRVIERSMIFKVVAVAGNAGPRSDRQGATGSNEAASQQAGG